MHARALRRLLPVLVVAALVAVPAAPASELIDRDVSGARLAVDGLGRAVVTYSVAGKHRSVVAWGAIDARTPTRSLPQVAFRLAYGQTALGARCGRYDGPALAWY